VKLNTSISVENVITVIVLVFSVTLAFGFMKYDIDAIKKQMDLKADENLINYKLDVIMQDITEIKQTLKESK
tara:strand:- start:631 stop:846 length:216 start_codon:yes stop_codon:yes gene_type:complete